MLNKDVAKLFHTSMTDTQMCAYAMSEFVKREIDRYDELSAVIQNIFEFNQETNQYFTPPSSGDLMRISNRISVFCINDIVQLDLENYIPGNNYVFDSVEYVNAIYSSLANFTNNNSIEDLDDAEDFPVTCDDKYSGESVTILWSKLTQYSADQRDALCVMQKMYEVLSKKSNSQSQLFSSLLNQLMTNKTFNITQMVTDFIGILDDTANSLEDKFQQVSGYMGINAMLQDPEESVKNNNTGLVDLGQYTGINPTAALISGLDFSNVGSAVLSTAQAAVAVTSKVVTTVANWIGDGISKLFRWCRKRAKQIFIDPVDCETSKDTYEYFDIPVKYSMGVKEISPELESYIRQHQPLWMNYGAVYERCYIISDTIYFEQHVKPVNPRTVAQIFEDELGTYTSWQRDYTKNSPSPFTVANFVNAFQNIKSADLSLSKDAGEKEVYEGLLLSKLLYNFFQRSSSWLIYVTTFKASEAMAKGWNVDYNPSERHFTGLNLISEAAIDYYWLGIWYRFYDTIYPIMKYMKDTSLSVTNSSATSYDKPIYYIDGVAYYFAPSTITNLDFIRALLLTPDGYFGTKFVGQTHIGPWAEVTWKDSYVHYSSVYTQEEYYNNSLWMDVSGSHAIDYVPVDDTQIGDGLLKTVSSIFSIFLIYAMNETNYCIPESRNAYIGYCVKNDLSFDISSRIKTDRENEQAVENFFKGVLIISAVIAVAVVTGVSIHKYVKWRATNQALALKYYSQFQKAVRNNYSTVDQNWKLFKSYNLRLKLTGRLFGTFGIGALPTTIAAVSSSAGANMLTTVKTNNNTDKLSRQILETLK